MYLCSHAPTSAPHANFVLAARSRTLSKVLPQGTYLWASGRLARSVRYHMHSATSRQASRDTRTLTFALRPRHRRKTTTITSITSPSLHPSDPQVPSFENLEQGQRMLATDFLTFVALHLHPTFLRLEIKPAH